MTSWRRPVQHIDRKELYTNLEARVRYLHSFLDFSSGTSRVPFRLPRSPPLTTNSCYQGDIDALMSGAKYVRALIPAVVNIVYGKLLQYDITARAFATRSTSSSGGCPDPDARAVVEEDGPQIRRRKAFLRAYLARLCSDPREPGFWEYLDKVGMMHVGLGRARPLHVEYVHVGATLALVQDVLVEAVLGHPSLRLERKAAIVKALGKVLWIQNDLFAKWYVEDGAEFTEGVDYGVIEKEGWLHGRKVLSEDVDGDEGSDETESAGNTTPTRTGSSADDTTPRPTDGVCPFTGLTAGGKELEVAE